MCLTIGPNGGNCNNNRGGVASNAHMQTIAVNRNLGFFLQRHPSNPQRVFFLCQSHITSVSIWRMGSQVTKLADTAISKTELKAYIEDAVDVNKRIRATETDKGGRIIKIKWGEHANDPSVLHSKALGNVATDFITRNFFHDDDTFFNFLHIVTSSYERALRIFRRHHKLKKNQVLFVYKGGNVMRFLGREFLLELPNSAIKEIEAFFAEYFKRGDADFGIYLDVNLEPSRFNDLHEQLGVISYRVQARLREIFNSDLASHFSFFRYNDQWQKHVLAPVVEALNAADEESKDPVDKQSKDPFEEVAVLGYVGCKGRQIDADIRPDVTLRFVNPEEDWMLASRSAVISNIEVQNDPGPFTISHNNALDFPNHPESQSIWRIQFNLTRTKVGLAGRRKSGAVVNVLGELIDVAIGTQNDPSVLRFFKDREANTARYNLGLEGGRRLQFTAYSLRNIIDDLKTLMFEKGDAPWNDRKYKKRVHRMAFLIFVEIYVGLDKPSQKQRLLLGLTARIYGPMASGILVGEKTFIDFATAYKDRLPGTIAFLEAVEATQSIHYPNTALQEMMSILDTDSQFLSKSVEKVLAYCSKVHEDAVYGGASDPRT